MASVSSVAALQKSAQSWLVSVLYQVIAADAGDDLRDSSLVSCQMRIAKAMCLVFFCSNICIFVFFIKHISLIFRKKFYKSCSPK